MDIKQKNVIVYGIAGLILALPVIGMLISEEVKWSFFDFLVAGILLFSSAFFINTILNKKISTQKKIWGACVIIAVLIIIWVELAVGIFNSPLAGN